MKTGIGSRVGFAPGSQPPKGYPAWQQWAGVQQRAGLRQKRCPKCGLWKFPQEMETHECKPTAAATGEIAR